MPFTIWPPGRSKVLPKLSLVCVEHEPTVKTPKSNAFKSQNFAASVVSEEYTSSIDSSPFTDALELQWHLLFDIGAAVQAGTLVDEYDKC